ncbi:MAG: FAD/NAD(P)-binding protein [Candidatus Cloacimonetes bacterium]|nr:FAD/NAD(P)-binding protein [Candidatus Cloacimonadota bacterium]
MSEKNIYKPIKFHLDKVVEETPAIKTFFLSAEQDFNFKTGQFVEVTIDGVGEAPYTPSSSPYVKDRMELTVMKAGYVTDKMHQLKGGEILGIRGPFGKGYPVEKFYNREIIILGGGVGLAPLRCLIYSLLEEEDKFRKINICFGAKTPADFCYKNWFPELLRRERVHLLRSVDKADSNWNETVGVVTVLLDKLRVDWANLIAIVCGPPIMMKFGTLRLLELGCREENIYLSMEKNMSCGLGKCGHCAMGNYFVCKDGPVFTYDQIKNHPDIWI